MIKKEVNLFFTAMMFYTRLPCPSWITHEEDALNQSTRYFPMMGWIVGGIQAVIYSLATYVLPNEIAIILSMIASILATGAFHEDGFMDMCDAFGGGWTKEKILEIMKDSRMGAFGTIGIICMMLLKFYAIHTISDKGLWFVSGSIICFHALSRFGALLLRLFLDYVSENDDSKAKPIAKQTSWVGYVVALIFAIIPFLIFQEIFYWLIFVPIVIWIAYLTRFFKKWIGGYTGDCLGATQQLIEISLFIGLLISLKFSK